MDNITDSVSGDVTLEARTDEFGLVLDVIPDEGDGIGIYVSREDAERLISYLTQYARGPRG